MVSNEGSNIADARTLRLRRDQHNPPMDGWHRPTRFAPYMPMTSEEALSRLRCEVDRSHAGQRAPLGADELKEFARLIRPDAECRIEIQDATDGPLIVVRAVKRPPIPRLLALLSPREREVARLIARGLSNPAISRELGIRPSTVKDHVHNILERVGLASRQQLAVAVAREEERALLET